MTNLYIIFNKLFKRGPLSYDVKKIYVNNKAICQTTICKNIYQLPTLKANSSVLKAMEKAFDYKENAYYQSNELIYLSQPYCEVEQYIAGTEEKEEYKIQMPDVEEFDKENLLALEKEVLGIYISGHPLEEYAELLHKNTTNNTRDFLLNEETNEPVVQDNATVVIGGMITEKNIKHTKTNQTMAFLTLEDLVGTVEVVVFPNSYEKNATLLVVDNKVFVRGRVNVEEERGAKLICEKIIGFQDIPKELWIKFSTKEAFVEKEQELYGMLMDSDGKDNVVIYVEEPKAIKRLSPNRNVCANKELLEKLCAEFGENHVKIVEKSVDKLM